MEKMREIIHLNFDWEFTESFSSGFAKGEEVEITTVNLPHTCRETPFDYFDEGIYQMVCGYRRSLLIPGSARDKRIFLVIGAAAHSAQVYVNGIPLRREAQLRLHFIRGGTHRRRDSRSERACGNRSGQP